MENKKIKIIREIPSSTLSAEELLRIDEGELAD